MQDSNYYHGWVRVENSSVPIPLLFSFKTNLGNSKITTHRKIIIKLWGGEKSGIRQQSAELCVMLDKQLLHIWAGEKKSIQNSRTRKAHMFLAFRTVVYSKDILLTLLILNKCPSPPLPLNSFLNKSQTPINKNRMIRLKCTLNK